MAKSATEQPAKSANPSSLTVAWLVEGLPQNSTHVHPHQGKSPSTGSVLTQEVGTPDGALSDKSAVSAGTFQRDIGNTDVGEGLKFSTKKRGLNEWTMMPLAGLMMFLLLPFLTNQNGITSANSSDLTSYIAALRVFWTSILHRIILH